MTNQPKRYTVLIGDDAAASSYGLDLFSTVLALWDYSSEERKEKIRKDEEGDLIVFNHVPFGEGSSLAFRVVSTVEEMIEEGKKPYDWKVTDMNYGNGRYEGGNEVVHALLPFKRIGEILAICTSESDRSLLERTQQLGIDYLINPKLAGFEGHKLELLGKVMAEHYKI